MARCSSPTSSCCSRWAPWRSWPGGRSACRRSSPISWRVCWSVRAGPGSCRAPTRSASSPSLEWRCCSSGSASSSHSTGCAASCRVWSRAGRSRWRARSAPPRSGSDGSASRGRRRCSRASSCRSRARRSCSRSTTSGASSTRRTASPPPASCSSRTSRWCRWCCSCPCSPRRATARQPRRSGRSPRAWLRWWRSSSWRVPCSRGRMAVTPRAAPRPLAGARSSVPGARRRGCSRGTPRPPPPAGSRC